MVVDSFLAQLNQFDGGMLSQLFIVAVILIVMIIFIIGRMAPWRRRRSAAILHALNESSRSSLVVTQHSMGGDFIATFDPAPAPFSSLTLVCVRASLGGTGAARRHKRTKADQLRFEGVLAAKVKAELLWGRGRIPARALGRGEGDELWAHHRIDLTGGEFIVRGANTGAIQHALFELQQRFNPFLCEVSIEATTGLDARPNVVIAVELIYGFNVEDTPALLKLVRAAGRAALLG